LVAISSPVLMKKINISGLISTQKSIRQVKRTSLAWDRCWSRSLYM